MCRSGPSLACLCILPSKKLWFLLLSIFTIFPISQIVIGSLYRRKCEDGGFYLSLWNLVSGILLLCAVTMEAVYSAVMRIRVPKRTYPLERPFGLQGMQLNSAVSPRHTSAVTPRRVIFYPLMVIVFQISIAVSAGFGLYLIFDVSCHRFLDIFTTIAVYLHLFGVIVIPAFCCVSFVWFRDHEDQDEDDTEVKIGSSFSPEKCSYPTYPVPGLRDSGSKYGGSSNGGPSNQSKRVPVASENETNPYTHQISSLTYVPPSCLDGPRPGRSMSLGSSGEFYGGNIPAVEETPAKSPARSKSQLALRPRSKTESQKPQRVALSSQHSGTRTYENIQRGGANPTASKGKSEFVHVRTPDKSIRFKIPSERPQGYDASFVPEETRNRIPVTNYQTGILKDSAHSSSSSVLPMTSPNGGGGGGSFRSVSLLSRNSPIKSLPEGRIKSLPTPRGNPEEPTKREPLLSTFASSSNRSEDELFQLKTDVELQSNV